MIIFPGTINILLNSKQSLLRLFETGMGDGTEIPWDLSPGIGTGTDFRGTAETAGTGTGIRGTVPAG